MKTLDLPPVWLVACLFVTSSFGGNWEGHFAIGLAFIAIGVGLTIAALVEFRRAKTTVIPHQTPSSIISSGVFGFSRNPIYLADLLLLFGYALIQGSIVGVLLTPVLLLILDKRFIQPEEARMADAFGESFADYKASVRKWL